jgi:hypothetical protein
MKKRFIAYFIGMFLAIFAFSVNADAQEIPSSEPPCEEIDGDIVNWSAEPFKVNFTLRCGCEVTGEVQWGYDSRDRLHLHILWYAVKPRHYDGCQNHTIYDFKLGQKVSVDDRWGGLENMIEYVTLDVLLQNDLIEDVTGSSIISSRASCVQTFSFESTSDDNIVLGPIIRFDFEKSFMEYNTPYNASLFPPLESITLDKDWEITAPCSGTACCVSYLFIDVDYSNTQPRIDRAVKTTVFADELSGECKGICKYDCHNMDYEYHDSRIKLAENRGIESTFSISPNPNNGHFKIFSNIEENYDYTFVITNLQGQEQAKGQIIGKETTFDNDKILQPGTYILLLKKGSEIIESTKFIVHK